MVQSALHRGDSCKGKEKSRSVQRVLLGVWTTSLRRGTLAGISPRKGSARLHLALCGSGPSFAYPSRLQPGQRSNVCKSSTLFSAPQKPQPQAAQAGIKRFQKDPSSPASSLRHKTIRLRPRKAALGPAACRGQGRGLGASLCSCPFSHKRNFTGIVTLWLLVEARVSRDK